MMVSLELVVGLEGGEALTVEKVQGRGLIRGGSPVSSLLDDGWPLQLITASQPLFLSDAGLRNAPAWLSQVFKWLLPEARRGSQGASRAAPGYLGVLGTLAFLGARGEPPPFALAPGIPSPSTEMLASAA